MNVSPWGKHLYESIEARDELVAALHAQESNGVVVSGPVGSLKAELVAASFGAEFTEAVHLLCSPVSIKNSFGALAPLLIEMDAPADELTVFRYLSRRMVPALAGERLLMIIEEAQFLDVASAFILSQLALAGKIKLILLAVGDGHTEPVVASTELGARLSRVTLNALSLGEISDHARSILGAPTSQATNQIIAETCAGNPLLIEAFIASARAQGVLRESKGWFVMTQAHIENDESLSDVVAEVQKRLNEADSEALEILALGGPEDSQRLAHASGTALARLLGTGLVCYDTDSRLRISAPLYGQVLRDLVPPGRSKHLWSRMFLANPRHGSLPNSVQWALESGGTKSPDEYRQAIEVANQKADFLAAWSLCQMTDAWQQEPEVAVQAARALVGLGRYQLAQRCVDKALELGDDPRTVLGLRSTLALAKWQYGDAPQGIGPMLSEWANQCRQWQLHPQRYPAAEVERNVRAIEMLQLWADIAQGQDPELLLERARSMEVAAAVGGLEHVLGRDAKCGMLLRLGRFVEATDEATANLDAVPPGSALEPVVGYQVMATALRALVAVGEYTKARLIVARRMPKNLGLYLHWAGTMHFWAAFAAVQEGRWHFASSRLYESRAELALRDPNRLESLAEALCNFEKIQLLDADDPAWSEGIFPHRQRGWLGNENIDANILAQAYASLIEPDQANGKLWILVGQARAAGSLHTELQLLLMLWRLSLSREVDPRIMERLEKLGIPGLGRRDERFMGAGVWGDAPDDIGQLIKTADDLFSHGETGLGVEMLAAALRVKSLEKDERQRGIVLRRIASWISELDGTPWGTLHEVMRERNLSSREKEIIVLVREGMSNKEIAKHLTLSQRTVEGHLYRVFAKLGISGRNELD